jgi:hypothetical protein
MVGSCQPSENQIRRGAEEFALIEKERGHTWDRWKHVIVALNMIDALAMREAKKNVAKGGKFNKAVAKFLRCYGLDRIHKSDRSRMRKYAGKLEEIDAWRAAQPIERQLELNHPRIVYDHWSRRPRPASDQSSERPTATTSGKKKKLDLTAWPAAEVTEALEAYRFEPFMKVMPGAWRPKLERRIAGLSRTQAGEPSLLKPSEILRRALSLAKIAATATGITPAVAAGNEKEAIAALRRLNIALTGVDIDEITIIQRYAKAKRRAA